STRTSVRAGAKPGAEAVRVADPRPMPLSAGCVDVVVPAGMKTLAGLTAARAGSLLVSVMSTPFAGAGTDRLTGNGAVFPGWSVAVAGSTIAGGAALSRGARVRY